MISRGPPGSFDAGSVATPGAAFVDGKVVLSYTAEDQIGSPCGINVAVSTSGGFGPFVKQARPVVSFTGKVELLVLFCTCHHDSAAEAIRLAVPCCSISTAYIAMESEACAASLEEMC